MKLIYEQIKFVIWYFYLSITKYHLITTLPYIKDLISCP